MAIIRLENVDQNTSDLVKDAANRVGMKKHFFIIDLLNKVAKKEYEQQQREAARTGSNE